MPGIENVGRCANQMLVEADTHTDEGNLIKCVMDYSEHQNMQSDEYSETFHCFITVVCWDTNYTVEQDKYRCTCDTKKVSWQCPIVHVRKYLDNPNTIRNKNISSKH